MLLVERGTGRMEREGASEEMSWPHLTCQLLMSCSPVAASMLSHTSGDTWSAVAPRDLRAKHRSLLLQR